MAIATMRVPTIFTAVDKFSDVVSKMTRKTTAFGATAQAAAMRTSRSFNSAGNKMLGAGVAIGAGLGYAVNEAMTFEDKLSNLNTILNATPQELENIKQTIFDVAKSTGVPLDDLASQFYELASAQIKGVDASNALNYAAKLSVAGIGTMQQATEVMIGSLNGFRGEGLKANEVFEDIAKTVQNGKLKINDMSQSFAKNAVLFGLAGGKYKEYLAATSAMTTTTMPASEVQNALGLASMSFMKMGSKLKKGLSSSGIGMSDYTKKQNELQKVILPLGARSGTDLIKLKGGVVPAIVAIAKQAKKMGIELATIFPRQGALAAASLLAGAALKDESKIMGLLADNTTKVGEAMLRAKENTQIKWNRLKNEAKILAITIGDSLLPRIKDMAESAINVVKGLASWAKESKWLANILLTTTEWLIGLGVSAKILSLIFLTGARFIKGYKLALLSFGKTISWVKGIIKTLNIASLISAAEGTTIQGTLLGISDVAAVSVVSLGGVAAAFELLWLSMEVGNNTTRSFAFQNNLALAKVTSDYTITIDTIVKKMDEAIKKMKQLKDAAKLDLPSALTDKNMGKINAYEKKLVFNNNAVKPTMSLSLVKPRFGDKIDSAYDAPTAPQNLAGQGKSDAQISKDIYGVTPVVEVHITTDKGTTANVINEPQRGVKVITTPNQGSRGTVNTN